MKRPWNLVDMPVYSLATYDEAVNMNICTYVSAVSMKPKIYMVAIDYQTKTFQNLENSDTAVLQVLHQDNIPLIRLLGKSSGRKVDKASKLKSKGFLTSWQEHGVLTGACAYLLLRMIGRTNIGGDHELFYFNVEKSSTKRESGILMFQELVDKGVIL